MKKVLIIMAVVLMLGVNAYADGDLTVAGQVGLGSNGRDSVKVDIFTDETYTTWWGGEAEQDGLSVRSNGIAISASSSDGPAGRFNSEFGIAGYFSTASTTSPAIQVKNSNLVIGNYNDSSYALYVNGSGYATGTFQSSDVKYKKNISSIDSPLDKILSLKGVSYEWKTEEYKDKGFSEGENYGVIAQEVEKVLPEIVREGKVSGKAVSYTQIIPVLIEAIKEQQKTINELKAQQAVAMEQQRTIAGMSEKLAWLEKQMLLKDSVVMVDITQP